MEEPVAKSDKLIAAEHVMRITYRPLTEIEQTRLGLLKAQGAEFWYLLDCMDPSREVSLAKTAIEEAVMWATKHITR